MKHLYHMIYIYIINYLDSLSLWCIHVIQQLQLKTFCQLENTEDNSDFHETEYFHNSKCQIM